MVKLFAVNLELILAIGLTVAAAVMLVLMIVMGIRGRKASKENASLTAEAEKAKEETAATEEKEEPKAEEEAAEEEKPAEKEPVAEEETAEEETTEEPAAEEEQPVEEEVAEEEATEEVEEPAPEEEVEEEPVAEEEQPVEEEVAEEVAEPVAEEEKPAEEETTEEPVEEQPKAEEEVAAAEEPKEEEPAPAEEKAEEPKEEVVEEPVPVVEEPVEEKKPEKEVPTGEMRVRYRLSFRGKVVQADEAVQTLCGKLEDELKSYSALTESESWTKIRFFEGKRNTIAYLLFRNKILNLAFAVPADSVDLEKYGATDVSEIKRFKKTPVLVAVTDESSLEKAEALLKAVMENYGGEKNEVEEREYVMPHEEPETLVEKGLAKKRFYVPRPRKKK